MKDLANYTILITGGASGNGYGLVKYCGQYFKKIIVVDKDKDKLSELTTNVENLNIELEFYCCNLESLKERQELIDLLLLKKEIIHCLVNNAGISIATDLADDIHHRITMWNRTLEVNLTAPFHLCSELSKLIPDDIGSIINITSLNSTLAFPGNPAYMASKGGLRQLTQSFAYDLSSRGIRVNSIAPGYMKTNMTALSWNDLNKREERTNRTMLARWGDPLDLGGVVCFLASNLSSYITAEEIYVDGGWSSKGL